MQKQVRLSFRQGMCIRNLFHPDLSAVHELLQHGIRVATLKMDLSDIKSARTRLERERQHMGVEAGKVIAEVKLKHLHQLKAGLPPNKKTNPNSTTHPHSERRVASPAASASPESAMPIPNAADIVVSNPATDSDFKFLRRRYRRYTDADISRRLKGE